MLRVVNNGKLKRLIKKLEVFAPKNFKTNAQLLQSEKSVSSVNAVCSSEVGGNYFRNQMLAVGLYINICESEIDKNSLKFSARKMHLLC